MAADTALSRVTKSDFFTILGSGTYVVASYGLLAAAVLNRSQKPSVKETLSWLSGEIESHWPMAVAFLFLAFLIGNALRALPVNLVDNWWKSWFALLSKRIGGRGEKSDYYRALWQSSFPYGDMLELELKALKANLPKLDFAIPPQGTRHSMFNFWKAELCRESAAAFEFTQELEGRVRLFATMFWGALLGLVAALIGLLLCACSVLGPGWPVVLCFLFILSALIWFVFGSQLRRVRGQEVASVFIAYMALILKKGSSDQATPGRVKSP